MIDGVAVVTFTDGGKTATSAPIEMNCSGSGNKIDGTYTFTVVGGDCDGDTLLWDITLTMTCPRCCPAQECPSNEEIFANCCHLFTWVFDTGLDDDHWNVTFSMVLDDIDSIWHFSTTDSDNNIQSGEVGCMLDANGNPQWYASFSSEDFKSALWYAPKVSDCPPDYFDDGSGFTNGWVEQSNNTGATVTIMFSDCGGHHGHYGSAPMDIGSYHNLLAAMGPLRIPPGAKQPPKARTKDKPSRVSKPCNCTRKRGLKSAVIPQKKMALADIRAVLDSL